MSRRKNTQHTQEGFSLPVQVTITEILHRGRNLSVKEEAEDLLDNVRQVSLFTH